MLGYFRPTVNGVLLEPELATAPSRDRIKLGISYSMSQDMRQALAEAELDVEIQKATSGPQLYSVVSAQDALHPDAATRGQGVPSAPERPHHQRQEPQSGAVRTKR